MSEGRAARRRRRDARRRTVAGVAAFVVAIAIVPVLLVLDGGSPTPDPEITRDDALAVVRGAIGKTVAAGSYEMDTETRSSAPDRGTQFSGTSHGIVNFEPAYVARIESNTTYGTNVLWVTPTSTWLFGASGNPVLGPGQPLSSFARAIVGALGPSPGALAVLGLAVPGGHLNLQEKAVATAQASGEGEVQGVRVVYYDVTIDMTRLAEVEGLSDVQRATIDYALPLLRQGGYTGTTERIGVDDEGYVREVTLTNHFSDGSTSGGRHVLSNFGCAPKLKAPDQGGSVTPVPCSPRAAPATTTTTTITGPPPTSAPVNTPPATVPPTSPSTVPPSTPATTAPPPSTTSRP